MLDILVILDMLAILDILVILDILDTLHTTLDIILPITDTMDEGDIHTMLETNKLLDYRHHLVQVSLKKLLLLLLWLMMARHMMNI